MRFVVLLAVVFTVMFLSAAVFSFVTMWAWNVVVPAVFGLPEISLLQAFALNLLAGLLVKSASVSAK